MTILDYWMFDYDPRESQRLALEWLEKQDAKYLLLEAPVGTGKSNVGLTFSQYLGARRTDVRGDSFILTPQRILQKQYEDSIKGNRKIQMASFYGKGNYNCKQKNSTCDIGALVKPKCGSCPFASAKEVAKAAADTVLNYKLALTSFAYTTTFEKRKLVVFDECHTLESHLVDFDALRVSDGYCQKYRIPFKPQKDILQALDWVKTIYVPKLRVVKERMEGECEYLLEKSSTNLTRSEINKIRELDRLQNHYDEAVEVSFCPPAELKEDFVLVWDKYMFQFKRLTGEYSFHKIAKPFGDKFLFMSSTILGKDGFCDDLGIPKEDTAFLSLTSDFAKENRPVVFMPQMKMNIKWNDPEQSANRKKMLAHIKQILELHKDDTGIIHTGNFKIAEWLVKELNGKINHHIHHHNPESGYDRNSVIEAFLSDVKPSILISPSSTEGLDLKDDLGRFAIFCKVPFGFLGDQWIKRRMELSNQWYQRRALIDIIQGGGRVVRSGEDKGVVYILDQSWGFLHDKAYYMIPQWWRDAYSAI